MKRNTVNSEVPCSTILLIKTVYEYSEIAKIQDWGLFRDPEETDFYFGYQVRDDSGQTRQCSILPDKRQKPRRFE